MQFIETDLPGVYVIERQPFRDERGSFCRTFCRETFVAHGLTADFVQCNASFNPRAGTLRGMHYQLAPQAETKLIRCTRGAVYSVGVDLRRRSPAFCRWFAVELRAGDARSFYLPHGIAHGYLTLEDGSELEYQVSAMYEPSLARGVRYDDPAFGIRWPREPTLMSQRDRAFEYFRSDATTAGAGHAGGARIGRSRR